MCDALDIERREPQEDREMTYRICQEILGAKEAADYLCMHCSQRDRLRANSSERKREALEWLENQIEEEKRIWCGLTA